MAEKEKRGKTEEPPKNKSADVQMTDIQETLVNAASVADIREGIVSGSSVQQFRSQIEQTLAQQNKQSQQTQPKEKKENSK